MKHIKKHLEELLHDMQSNPGNHDKHCLVLKKILADDWTNDPDQDGDDDTGTNQGLNDPDGDSNPPGGPGGGHP